MPYDLRKDHLLGPLPSNDEGKCLGRCVLTDRIGQGGMGIVYRGRHLDLHREVAVKCLFTSWVQEDHSYVQRFQREARLAQELRHPHLVEVIEAGCEHEIHFLVMEFVEGVPLGRLVRRQGPLDPVSATTIVRDACSALAVAHTRGVVHRDIKPDNLLVDVNGKVKVADLGLAKATRSRDAFATASGVVLGSVPYMPPEQFQGLTRVGPPGDVYALAATLDFALTGEVTVRTRAQDGIPVDGHDRPQSLRDRQPHLPQALVDIVDRATHPEPTERFPNAADLGVALDSTLDTHHQATPYQAIGRKVSTVRQRLETLDDEGEDFAEAFPTAEPTRVPEGDPSTRAPGPPPLPAAAIRASTPLHLTNDDTAADALRSARIFGEVLPWRDVLHEGPVPEGPELDALGRLRARWLGSQPFDDPLDTDALEATFEDRDRSLIESGPRELNLWFEKGPSNQLQACQILSWCAESGRRPPRLVMVGNNPEDATPIASLSAQDLVTAQKEAPPLGAPALVRARDVWSAFRAPDPRHLERMAHSPPKPDPLPWLTHALRRILLEWPAPNDGLGLTERRMLSSIHRGARHPSDVLHAIASEEPFPFLPDSILLLRLAALANEPRPLVRRDSDGCTLTEDGQDVLGGHADAVRLRGVDRWHGGVHLLGRDIPFRVDPHSARLVTERTGA